MLISLRNDHRQHLKQLSNETTQVVTDFCKIAIDFLQNGPNTKLYNTAAKKLNWEMEDVQNCVYSLVYLLVISCKHKLNESDFRDCILTIGFTEEQQSVLSSFYETKNDVILEALKKTSFHEPHYNNLDWRFEVQVASRSLLHQCQPLVAMNLTLTTEKSAINETIKENIYLQSNLTNLLHVTEELEKALVASKSRHARRIQNALS
nr:COMM domain-containing protein 2 [Onthophagus taurus]